MLNDTQALKNNLVTTIFPTQEERINKWSNIYKVQGQRWGLLPSLLAHKTLSLIYKSTKEEKKLLDIGFGYGRDVFLFRSVFKDLVCDGLDAAASAIQMAYNLSAIQNVRHCFNKNIFDFQKEIFGMKYDVVYANYFLHLFSDNEIMDIMQIISDITTKGGFIVLSFVSTKDRHYGKGKLLAHNTYEVFQALPWRFMDTSEVRNVCDKIGLNIMAIEEGVELEQVQGKPDPVGYIHLIASKG